MNVPELAKQLDRIVTYAVTRIPMFGRMYAEDVRITCLNDFKRLPVTNREVYASLGDVAQCVANPWEMVAPLAPWDKSRPRFPLAVLYSAQDEAAFEERVQFLLGQVGIPQGDMVTILVGPQQIYTASDLADILIYLGHPTHLLLCNMASVGQRLMDAAPVTLFLLNDFDTSSTAWPSSVRHVVSFDRQHVSCSTVGHCNVLHLDELPFIAVRSGDGPFRPTQGHFFFEQSDHGTLLITTLKLHLFPFIRYDTGFRGTVVGSTFYTTQLR